MDTKIIGDNIKVLRETKGIAQKKLAEQTGLSLQTIKKIEKGNANPQINTLQVIASVLGIKFSELFRLPQKLEHVRFRSLKKMRCREYVLITATRMLKDCLFLEKELKLPLKSFLLKGLRNQYPNMRIEEFARECRKKLGLKDREPVYDFCGLMNKAGVRLLGIPLESDGFFGLSVGEEDGGPAIFVNTCSKITIERQLFSAAHELGHLLLHHDEYNVTQDMLEQEKGIEETEANLFASHFLMPEHGVAYAWKQAASQHWVDRVLKVKALFGVSYKTVLYRWIQTGGIDNTIWMKFKIDYKNKYGKKLLNREEPRDQDEPFRLPPFQFSPCFLNYLVKQALDREIITVSRAAEILGLSISDVRDLQVEPEFFAEN